uniref:Glycoside hydrolase family 5 n=1 Tax=uncultured bacterium contig00039 TaxID=1181527 RepID=A0A806K252_9BACT|nr:glycoside hydrolase family 5 [uncultured bacterium contig00039]
MFKKIITGIVPLIVGLMLVLAVVGCNDDRISNYEPPDIQQSFNDKTAAQLVAGMTVGWNLGNTLDAAHLTWLGSNPTVTQMETAWGNPVTTQANITAVKNAGFNTIRIPVSWTKAVDSNYNIRTDWMKRVTEVVNYAASNNMYIILNTHHDEDVFKFTNAQKTASLAAFKKIWEQIADNFKDHNEKLIFEALNEPRNIGASWEWSGGNAEERDNLNEHYKVFVDTVRASGGNNDKRILMVNTYAASGTAAAINGLVIPNDTAVNKIIVSYHNYAPYDFALNTNSALNKWSSSNSGDTSVIKDPIDRVTAKFINNGIPVVIGEFGAMNKNNEATRAAWAQYYVGYARSKGIPCVWWDNGVTTGSGELFGILNRNNNTWVYPQVVTAMVNAASTP